MTPDEVLDLMRSAPERYENVRAAMRYRGDGREAVRLVCVMRKDWDHDPDPLWWGADEYELPVDVERGVVLRVASRLRGEEIDSLEAEEIYFDEPFPEDVFTSPRPLPWRGSSTPPDNPSRI